MCSFDVTQQCFFFFFINYVRRTNYYTVLMVIYMWIRCAFLYRLNAYHITNAVKSFFSIKLIKDVNEKMFVF